jgi:hypothetical protein
MASDIDLIWGKHEAEYFCKRDWTGQITLIRFRKFLFARTRRSLDGANGSASTGRKNVGAWRRLALSNDGNDPQGIERIWPNNGFPVG